MELTARVPLPPHLNFRDVGGYEARDGARVRTGALYRSANLADADDDAVAGLAALEIRTVCDLRAPEEAAARPSPLARIDGAEVLGIGVIGGRAIGDPAVSIIEYGFDEVRAEDVTNFYRFIVDEQPRVFGQVVEVAAHVGRHAVVVHCSAGKDRTGIACALVLAALGVDDETIIADYSLTNDLWSPAQIDKARPTLESAGVDVDRVANYFLAPAVTMEATLAHVRGQYGSVEAYLTGPGQVAEDTLTDLADALLN